MCLCELHSTLYQVVVVLASDWTVVCLDHELKLLWKSQPIKHTEDTIHIRYTHSTLVPRCYL